MVRRRHVYHLAGYDPIDAGAQYRRFARQRDLFQRTWHVDAVLSDQEPPNGRPLARWTVEARASNWRVEAVHELLLWDDIVRGDSARPMPARLVKATLTYLDFIATGTMVRYIIANQRYAIFFFIPLVQLALLAGAAATFATLLTAVLGLAGAAAVAVGALAGLAAFAALLRWPGRRWRVAHLLDDWIFARDYLYGRRPDIEARLDRFAEELAARAGEGTVDEIVIVGHSLGAMLALDMVDRALASDPDVGRRGPAICVLTVGATIPKFALHPLARRIHDIISRVVAEPAVAWVEYQSRDDTISFYKFDPVSLRRLGGDRLAGKPVIRRVQLHQMLQPETLARHRNNILRLHYQSVMANEKRASYDYLLMVCSPVPFLRWTTSPSGLLDFIEADGSYRDSLRDPVPRFRSS
jgi:hypothetical protein